MIFDFFPAEIRSHVTFFVSMIIYETISLRIFNPTDKIFKTREEKFVFLTQVVTKMFRNCVKPLDLLCLQGIPYVNCSFVMLFFLTLHRFMNFKYFPKRVEYSERSSLLDNSAYPKRWVTPSIREEIQISFYQKKYIENHWF